jgi:hypothetical protein
MAASKSQGSYFGLFLVGCTLLSGGIAYIAGASGKVLLLIGAAVVVVSFVGFRKIRPLEGETPLLAGSAAMKWIGALVALLGWAVTMGGLRLTESSGGRILFALIGIGLSLFGMLYVLPTAFNKTAFWKKPSSSAVRKPYHSLESGAAADADFTVAPSGMGSAR